MSDNILDQYKTGVAQEEKVDTERIIRCGIIGTGWIAEAHAREYKKMPDVQIVAAAELIPGKAEKFFEKMEIEGVHIYQDMNEMFEKENLDIVSICTYNTQHAPCAICALEHGVNVLLEKPFTVTLDEAVEVMKAEKKSGKLLTLGFQPRMSINMQIIKRIVESGELGDIYYIQSGGGRRNGIPTPYGTTFIEKETGGIGAIGDIGCYSLDMLLNAVGYPKPLTATGYTSDFFGKDPKTYEGHPEYAEKFGVDDFAAGFVRLEGGIILDFRISWAAHMNDMGDALILGTKGGMRIPSTDCWNGEFDKPLTIYKNLEGREISYEVPRLKNTAPLFYQKCRAFVDAVKYGGKPTVPTSEGVINQAIIDALVRSAKLGREVEVVIPEV